MKETTTTSEQTLAVVFTVTAQNLRNPDVLLLLGGDGLHYRYDVIAGTTTPLDLILPEEWLFDARDPPAAA